MGADGWCRLSTPVCMHGEQVCGMLCTTEITMRWCEGGVHALTVSRHAFWGRAVCMTQSASGIGAHLQQKNAEHVCREACLLLPWVPPGGGKGFDGWDCACLQGRLQFGTLHQAGPQVYK